MFRRSAPWPSAPTDDGAAGPDDEQSPVRCSYPALRLAMVRKGRRHPRRDSARRVLIRRRVASAKVVGIRAVLTV